MSCIFLCSPSHRLETFYFKCRASTPRLLRLPVEEEEDLGSHLLRTVHRMGFDFAPKEEAALRVRACACAKGSNPCHWSGRSCVDWGQSTIFLPLYSPVYMNVVFAVFPMLCSWSLSGLLGCGSHWAWRIITKTRWLKLFNTARFWPSDTIARLTKSQLTKTKR